MAARSRGSGPHKEQRRNPPQCQVDERDSRPQLRASPKKKKEKMLDAAQSQLGYAL